jgi:hypothetical protein
VAGTPDCSNPIILPVELIHSTRFQLLMIRILDATRECVTDKDALVFKSNEITRRTKMSIWTILFVVLLIAWLGGLTVFHVAGGLIHLLLVFAVISLILHFVMGTRTA